MAMLRDLVATFFRSLRRNRLAAGLNILGLSIGIAIFVLLMQYVRSETRYESWLPQADKVYGVRQVWNLPGVPPREAFSTSGVLLEALQSDFANVRGVRVMDATATVRAAADTFEEPLRLVDPNFLQIFPFELAQGDLRHALRDPESLVVSEPIATKYFGTTRALGRRLNITLGNEERVYRVTGVLAPLPRETDLGAGMLVPLVPGRQDPAMFQNWGATMLQTFLHLESPEDAEALERRMPAMVQRRAIMHLGPQASQQLKLRLVPLRSMHLIEREDRVMVATLGLVALLILALACINYVNLATARAGLRAREVAIRKVVGATRRQLMLQFLGEAVATALIAGAIGLAIAELLLPYVNGLVEPDLELSYWGNGSLLLPMFGVLIGVGLVSGVYPAIVLSAFRPASVLGSARDGGGPGGARLREALILAQFTIAIAFIIATAIIFSQLRLIQTADLGFERSGLILVPSTRNPQVGEAQRTSFVERARALPGVVSAAMSDATPGDESITASAAIRRLEFRGGQPPPINVTITGRDFFRTYRARLVAGRFFSESFGTDNLSDISLPVDAATDSAILNRAALPLLGFASAEQALGQRLRLATPSRPRHLLVVGVIENLRFYSPRQPVAGTVYLFQSQDIANPVASFRFSGTAQSALERQLEQIWRTLVPNVPFQSVSADTSLARYYLPDVQRSRAFTGAAIAAVLISCLGLYGLASFNASRRTREIGIRKALGATNLDIFLLLARQSLRPVLLANLIAWPIAFVVMRNWLNGFDQRVSLSPLLFLGATAITLAIAMLTVAGRALWASRTRPAEALRYE